MGVRKITLDRPRPLRFRASALGWLTSPRLAPASSPVDIDAAQFTGMESSQEPSAAQAGRILPAPPEAPALAQAPPAPRTPPSGRWIGRSPPSPAHTRLRRLHPSPTTGDGGRWRKRSVAVLAALRHDGAEPDLFSPKGRIWPIVPMLKLY
jgi:hypothetical protein